MNKKIKLVSLIFTALFYCGCAAQQQIYTNEPLENYIDYYNNDMNNSSGTYFKDINNLLDRYKGTWVGTHDGKTYTFVITEVTIEGESLKFDELRLLYSILSSNNTIIETTLSLPNSSPYVVNGWYISENEEYYTLDYIGDNAKCGKSGTFYLTPFDNDTKLSFWFNPNGGSITSRRCPNGAATQDFPVGKSFILV